MKERGRRSERQLEVERALGALATEPGLNVARFPGGLPRKQKTLAYTTTSSTYPTEGNKFEIMFVDASYTPAAGSETPSLTDRQVSPSEWVLNIERLHIPQNTLLGVFQVGQKWYTSWCCGEEPSPSPQCTSCTGDGPDQLEVVITGIVNKVGGCADCADLNGTYILDPISYRSGPLGCYYGLELTETACTTGAGVNYLHITIYSSSGNIRVLATLEINFGGLPIQNLTWFYEGSGLEDCLDWEDKDIPFSTDFGTECDSSASTLEITAL